MIEPTQLQSLTRSAMDRTAQLSLTFGRSRRLTRPFIGKTFFSTRRPALEAGGQRPTARCALGRKSVLSVRHGDDGCLLPRPALAGRGWGEGLLLASCSGTPSSGASRRPLPA